jgi:uncharacterized Zn-finger protein
MNEKKDEVIRVRCPHCGRVFFANPEGDVLLALSRDARVPPKGTVKCPGCGRWYRLSEATIVRNDKDKEE